MLESPPLIETMETYRCFACDSAIPSHRVHKSINHRTGIQTIRAGCEHCKTAVKLRRRLQGSVWVNIGSVNPITNPQEKADFFARIHLIEGDRQIS